MKKTRILQVVSVCAGLVAMQSQAALLVTGQNPSSPFYAEFTSSGLNVSYTTNSTGTGGTLTARSKTDPSTGNAYTSGKQSAGTQGNDDSTGFNGFYTLTAMIQGSGNNWQVTGGTVDVYGNLLGGSSSTLLLSANLKTGFNALGYGASGTKEFDFLFTASSGDGLGQNANALILDDFFGAGTGQGAIILEASSYNFMDGYTSFAKDFAGTGMADTFVPEPAIYTMGGGLMALSSLAFIRRPRSDKTSAV